MDEIQARLSQCFLAVFPAMTADQVPTASSLNTREWDSVAGVTLLAVIEEEFGITIDTDNLSTVTSFQGFLQYLCSLEHVQ